MKGLSTFLCLNSICKLQLLQQTQFLLFGYDLQQTQQYNILIQISQMHKQVQTHHSFQETGISLFFCRVLSQLKYKNPTPIQYFSIKTGIDHPGVSLICRAKSGTGKTVAYLSLMLDFLINKFQQEKKTYSIIVLPTRQLAIQVYQTLKNILDLAPHVKAVNEQQKRVKSALNSLNAILTIGGISFEDDRKRYRQTQPEIVISTVGRLFEMMKSNTVILGKQVLFIFDQGDKLLSNIDQKLAKVLLSIPKQSRWLLYSATYSKKIILDLLKWKNFLYVQTMLKNNEMEVIITDKIEQKLNENSINFGQSLNQNSSIKKNGELIQQTGKIEDLHLQNIKKYQMKITSLDYQSIFDSKLRILVGLLSDLQFQKCLIFLQKKSYLQQLSQALTSQGIQHVLIHGSLSQAARFRMMNKINNTRIIVASDLLSRGIDIQLDLVILFDSRYGDTFWHRVGRTGRYGRTGVAISFDTIQDSNWNQYNEQQVKSILAQIQNFERKQWYGAHMTEIGKWQQFDQQKQKQNDYKYFDESKKQTISDARSENRQVGQKAKIKQQIKSDEKQAHKLTIEQLVIKFDSKAKLQKFIKQQILKCGSCIQLMKRTTDLTGYQFEILSFVAHQKI